MSSSDSDDEPLSKIATRKIKEEPVDEEEPPPKKLKKTHKKKKHKDKKKKHLQYSSKGFDAIPNAAPNDFQRPDDVWLYMKDLNPQGPYSCLLCSEWFINKSKLILHYVLNHRKDYCGICRYFVPDRDTWLLHKQYHLPLCCSQCTETFMTEQELRKHFSEIHDSVHCRLCFFLINDNEEYLNHLFQKHNVSNIKEREKTEYWNIEYDGCPKFLCILCSKECCNDDFFSHYVGYHRFTLKCITALLSGKDTPVSVPGANISSSFWEAELKDNVRVGYIDQTFPQPELPPRADEDGDHNPQLLQALIPEIKQEAGSDVDDPVDDKAKDEDYIDTELDETVKNYIGSQDFDVTLTEVVVMFKPYVNYIEDVLSAIKSDKIPINSNVKYEKIVLEDDIQCSLCLQKFPILEDFLSHMSKMHSVKFEPGYSCRICAASFDTENELQNHINQELGEFADLWLCQFCDKEFENREKTREHLIEHAKEIDLDNCFSPHLGFKCKYCPTLFWDETDREYHHKRAHYKLRKSDFYKCKDCDMMFSDKIWFVHHYYTAHAGADTVYMVRCCTCSVVLPSVADMRAHFGAVHSEARRVFCSLEPCHYRPFSHNKSFKFHLKIYHGPKPKRSAGSMSCVVCARQFSSARACGAHMALAHGPGRFKCKLCHDMLHSSDERKLHYLLKHPGRHPYECNICGKSFQVKSSLYIHRSDAHAPKPVLTCNYCGKQFMKKDSFREHLLIHEGPRHACSYCPMRFVQRSNMLRHERRHTGERPYTCHHCGRSFADKGACNSHMRTHTRTEVFTCTYCEQTFAQKSKLRYHIRKHTGENLETCTQCGKLFTSMCSLREHMHTHNKRDQSKCHICHRLYQNKRYLLRHIKSAHARTNTCPICDKTVMSNASLREHLMTHGSVKTFSCAVCPKKYAAKKSIMEHLHDKHGFQGPAKSLKEYYTMADPRDCNLGLDEETITAIFGPSKGNAAAPGYVIFPPLPQVLQKNEDETEKAGDLDEQGSSSSDGAPEGLDEEPVCEELFKRKKKKKKIIKCEYEDVVEGQEGENANALPKGNNEEMFVTVKIEPLDSAEE